MYGVGVYEKNVSFSGGIGIGYTHTNLILYDLTNPNNFIQGYPNIARGYQLYSYSNATGCAGVQATFHGKVVGFTIQGLLNFSNTITNYAVIAGISIGIQ